MRKIFFVLLVFICVSEFVQILPPDDYSQLTASSQACYANCQFCQIKTGFCEQCLAPYFQKDVNGNCVIVPGYNIQSSTQQLLSGNLFTPSNVSWSSNKMLNCTPDKQVFTQTLQILGPFSQKDGQITYRRSVSNHKYMKLKFFFFKMKWTTTDSLTIIIRNQNDIVLSNKTIKYSPKVPRQQMCSQTADDQRFSISFDFLNLGTTSLFIEFIPKMDKDGNAKWAISSFLLLTGRCHESCDDCEGSFQPTKCKNCKNFFIIGLDQTCSQCADGFRKILVNGVNKCQKCPIQYKSCQQNKQICFYNDLKKQLNQNCTWNTNKYVSNYLVNDIQFSGNLFTVDGSSSTYKCGEYSMVGLANRGQPITRIFTSLQVHQSLSMTFNIFIIDQAAATQKSIFDIYLDNERIQTLFINTQGISSICGGFEKQVFQTYPATKFFVHNNTQFVNITIRSSNTANWGIRNFRLSFHVCDQTCLQCSPIGCKTCKKYFGLKYLRCSECPKGSSPAQFDDMTCYGCKLNCLTCKLTKDQNNKISNKCTKCQKGYFVFEEECQKQPNVGQSVQKAITSWISPSQILLNNSCTIELKSNSTINEKNITFIVAQDTLTNTIKIIQPHFKMIVSFYLIKIDKWAQNQEIHLYLNDLLVLKKKYGQFGNRICFSQNQTDLITFQQIQYVDNNQTLTAFFEIVNSQSGIKRKFGISDFKIKPISCKQCQGFNFNYKVDYNYDENLRIQIIFNRLYVNNDPNLFKTIFQLSVNGKVLDYQLIGNDSIRYILQANPDKQIQLTNITVNCKYPLKVTTDFGKSATQSPFFQTRIMQQQYLIQKRSPLINNISKILVERYTPLESPTGGEGLRIFFQVVTRMVVYLGFASFFLGCMTPCSHFMHNIQKIWVHIYLASLTIPNLLKLALKGFRECQNQNITINPSDWQKGIPQQLYYNAPAFFQDYYHDINFFRNIYNVGFAAAIFLIFGIIAFFVLKSNVLGRISNNKIIRHFKLTFYRRPFFVLNSVIFYQYLTVCLACTLQFLSLSSKTNETEFSGITAAASVITFILATVYPIVHFFYLGYKQKDMYSIDYQISYRNRYHEIFYRFLPKNLWKTPNYQFIPIGFKQRFYNLIRFGQLWWISIVVVLMYQSPFAQTFIMVIMNFLHLLFVWISSISYTGTFKLLKSLELLFFLGLQLIILVTNSQNDTLTKSAYNTLGIVGIIFIFIILLLSFIRFIYTLNRIINEYKQDLHKQTKLDERLRNDDFYGSFEINNQKIGSEEA